MNMNLTMWNHCAESRGRTINWLRVSILMMLATAVILETWAAQVAARTNIPFSHVLPDTPEEKAFWAERRKQYLGGPHFKALKILVDLPCVAHPELLNVDGVDLPDSAAVVGIDLSGDACAFVIDAMLKPEKHIVSLMHQGTPVTVTYCNLVDCVRVLKDDASSPIPLHVGGLDVDNQLVFLFKGERYGQESTALPLDDVPFTRTTFGDWKQRHPRTRIYLGGTKPPTANEKT